MNTQHANLSTSNAKIRQEAHLSYFDMQLIGRYFEAWKSTRSHTGLKKKKKLWGHVIKVIQSHEQNVKIELSVSLCVKPYH